MSVYVDVSVLRYVFISVCVSVCVMVCWRRCL